MKNTRLVVQASFILFFLFSFVSCNNNGNSEEDKWYVEALTEFDIELEDYHEFEKGFLGHRILVNGTLEQETDSAIYYSNGIVLEDREKEYGIFRFRKLKLEGNTYEIFYDTQEKYSKDSLKLTFIDKKDGYYFMLKNIPEMNQTLSAVYKNETWDNNR